ncbi:MAG: 3-phosphoshikimate 1-carboxyvinyltransferase [Clostridia bacterium]|nr:3-phosphoshikimate 1-carboxyvinyltransferase [Clostridia bacterium]
MAKKFQGSIFVAPDKSISHRGVMLGSLAKGVTQIENYLTGEDCISTVNCFRALGVDIKISGTSVTVYGTGNLKQPSAVLNTGNSGTTTRLMAGLLSGYPIHTVLSGDESLNKRPMKRIITPLSLMGADIQAKEGNFCPLTIKGKEKLKAISYELPVASAQLKSALILAGLHGDGVTTIIEKEKSRDHTENMLRAMGANIKTEEKIIKVSPIETLSPMELTVPGDISSAAFFIVGALITKGSELLLKNVGMNPTRTGLLTVLKDMGANIQEENKRVVCGEPVCDLLVTSSDLKATTVSGEIIPALIDEIPILAVAAACAEGTTVIFDAKELRVKETDRITAICRMLETAGVPYEEFEDGFSVMGTDHIKGGVFESYGDHRMAMSEQILSLMSQEEFVIKDKDCVAISFPDFWELLERVTK